MRFDKNLEYYFLESFFVFLGNFKVWIMREHVNDHFKQDMRRREVLQYAAGHAEV